MKPLTTKGFSLVELLLVIAIITVLAGMGAFFTGGVLNSADLKTTGGDISSIFTRAREEAQARNTNVEVRFYRAPRESFDDRELYHLIGIGTLSPPESASDWDDPEKFTFQHLNKIYTLPDSTMLMENAPYSTLLTNAPIQGTEDNNLRGELDYKAITFTPETLSPLDNSQDWTLTLINRDESSTTPDLPKNYITLQLFPKTGRVELNQP